MGKSAQTAAVAANIDALNLWSFFQAKTIRQTTLRTAAEQTALLSSSDAAKKQIEAWRKTADRYQSEPDTGEGREQLAARAKAAEKKREALTAAYHHYETASAAVQIAIVMASASIITGIALLAWIASGLGLVAVVFCTIGFFFPTAVHLF
jgi:plasmid stabilization system protein ParE